jgi:hypothetical protein
MAQITLSKVRVAKNGIISYKANGKRTTGTVYFDKKMFPNGAPETLTVNAEGIQEPVAESAPAAQSQPAVEATTEAVTAL